MYWESRKPLTKMQAVGSHSLTKMQAVRTQTLKDTCCREPKASHKTQTVGTQILTTSAASGTTQALKKRKQWEPNP